MKLMLRLREVLKIRSRLRGSERGRVVRWGRREMVHCCRGLLRPEGSPSEPAGGREGTRHSFQFVPNLSRSKPRGIFSREGSYQEGHKVVNVALETIRRIDSVPFIALVPDPIHHQSELESRETSSERACGPVTLQLKTGRDKSKTPSSPSVSASETLLSAFPSLSSPATPTHPLSLSISGPPASSPARTVDVS